MGTYLYALDAPSKARKLLIDGDSKRVGTLRFYCRASALLHFENGEMNRMQQGLDLTQEAWECAGWKPDIVVVTSEDKGWTDGDTVREWPGAVSSRDEPDFHGRIIGHIKQEGRRWVLVSAICPECNTRFPRKNPIRLVPQRNRRAVSWQGFGPDLDAHELVCPACKAETHACPYDPHESCHICSGRSVCASCEECD